MKRRRERLGPDVADDARQDRVPRARNSTLVDRRRPSPPPLRGRAWPSTRAVATTTARRRRPPAPAPGDAESSRMRRRRRVGGRRHEIIDRAAPRRRRSALAPRRARRRKTRTPRARSCAVAAGACPCACKRLRCLPGKRGVDGGDVRPPELGGHRGRTIRSVVEKPVEAELRQRGGGGGGGDSHEGLRRPGEMRWLPA